jgi:basic membrane protein A
MRGIISLASALVMTVGSAVSAMAADSNPAILYDMGGKFDKSFNENAFNGMDKFRQETGAKVFEFEISRETEREQALQTFARQGASPIVVVGFAWSVPLEKIAPQYPDSKFVIIDSTVDAPNVQSIEFAYHEGAFVVGALAALKSKSNTVGFVGGMDIPIIRSFECGYESGAKHIKADIKVIQNMTGTTPSAWSDPARARELALSQFDQGADVVFGAAGGSTMGVLQAAADAKKLAIGVGNNQNGLHPGSVLTSATAYIDEAVYKSLRDGANGSWKGGTTVLGIKDKGVGWALDENNKPLLTEEDIKVVEQLMADIGDGKIKVPNYLETNACK